MTNPTNIFNFVAHDVLQHVLSPFLNAEDRFNLNAVLEPTERIFKRFPKDFAEKHAVRIAYMAQKCHAERINFWTSRAGTTRDESWKEYAIHGVNAVGKYADFFSKPVAAALFKYRAGRNHAASMISELTHTLSDESIHVSFMTDKIRAKIYGAIGVINSLTPEKHVILD